VEASLVKTERVIDQNYKMLYPTVYKTAQLSKLKVFYREAGNPASPTVLLLHGFPTSSHMFRNLIPALAPYAHLVAPDLPGFGNTESPTDGTFTYTFDNLALTVEELVEHLGLKSYFVYLMDYGAPTGFRLAIAHPERVLGLIVQNGNAYSEGLTPFWDDLKKYWKDRSPETEKPIRPILSFEATKSQYIVGAQDESKVSPDTWHHDYYFLTQPGHDQIQLDLFYDYRSNIPLYPTFHEYFRKYQWPTLIVWGKNDFIFGVDGAKAFLRDLPKAELHLLNGGHFVLEEYLDEAAKYMKDFIIATAKSA
jgi:pimeloyl-ACP methyl ester carboxylesterase